MSLDSFVGFPENQCVVGEQGQHVVIQWPCFRDPELQEHRELQAQTWPTVKKNGLS